MSYVDVAPVDEFPPGSVKLIVAGPGRYITILANAGHTYMYVNGIMYNTAGRSLTGNTPRLAEGSGY